jgi:hypothetical protein
MISKVLFKIAEATQRIEQKMPSRMAIKIALTVAGIAWAFFAFGIGAIMAMIIATPAALGSVFAAFPAGIIIWYLWYVWKS